ncbi:type II toxin-antitoxin system death-on-curing family toxin [Candidatus Bipolaricaulota bacterium]|nr:type II toxin-antitoxin system death-on-curing family toxin [Candidatus Bipolaricaulota bacterium]
MRYLTTDEVILIHERVLEKFGGAGGLRDWRLLDSAVQRPKATFEGKELYPNLFAKAAALGHSLVLNHPFVDGNKRTAWEAMKRFLGENGVRLRAGTEEIVELMLRIEDKSLGVEQIAKWLKGHSRKLESRS